MIKLTTKIEALLYIKGRPLSIQEITASVQAEPEEVEEALIELMSDYAHRESALEVIEDNVGYSLQLKSVYESLLKELIPAEVGKGALRTLAAIALKHPVLQTDLIEMRGSSAYQQVTQLVELGFIRKRPQAEGRSYWLEVTDKFHQYFEIDQLAAS